MNHPTKQKNIAIVSGASAGLGKEFALQIERDFFCDEIWLIARRVDPMREIADSFHKSKAVILSLNLTDPGDFNILAKKISDENPNIVLLVNNAGLGKIGPFSELGMTEQINTIDLNVRALTQLTHVAIPYMKAGAKILQVASSIAFTPAPYFAVYAATKAYVLSFSEALCYELKDKGIHVLAVCPGPVATEFFAVAQKNNFMKDRVGDAEPFNKFLMVSPREVVRKALRDAQKNKRISIYGGLIKAFACLMPFVPKPIAMRAMAMRKK